MIDRRILLAVLCAAASAYASPRTDPTMGRAVFTGATTPHATSIALSPAAIGLGSWDEVYVALAGALDQLGIELDRDTLGGPPSPGTQLRDIEMAPGAMLAFIYHFAGERVTIGLEAGTSPTEMFPANRDALRYHTLGGGERHWRAGGAVSLKLTDDIFVGATVSHQNTFLRLHYARDTALENGHGPGGVDSDCGGAPCGVSNPQATENDDIDVTSPTLSTSNLAVTIGGVMQIAHDIWLGVAYHTPPGFAVQSELAGSVRVTRAPRDGGAILAGDSVVVIQFPASVDAEVRARLPLQLDLHVGGRWEDLSRLTAYDVRMYGSTLAHNGIREWVERPRGMHDSFAGWAGVEQVDTGQTFLFGGRVGFETSAVPAARTSPITIAPTSFTADLGGQWRTPYHLILQLSYGVQYFPTVNTQGTSAFDPGAQITCIDSGYDYATAACQATRNGYAISTASGDYARIEHALRLGLRYDFQ
jgi:hypothetical protein